MPIELDPSLPPSLYPLAWLVGSWSGSGAVHRAGDADVPDRRIEQTLTTTARPDGTLAWRSVIHELDDSAPLPPTSAFAAAQPVAAEASRRLLLREDGVWTVGDPLPGQDLAAARAARPGDPAAFLSHALTAQVTRRDGETGQEHSETWRGEVRGPRVQLALGESAADGRPLVTDTRMFGYIAGRMMWLWERRLPVTAADPHPDLAPFVSLELHRA